MGLDTAIDIDAIYNGDKQAVGDAIRILTQLAATKSGIQVPLTNRIIVPKVDEDGLVVQAEDGTVLVSFGAGGGTAGMPAAGVTEFPSDVNFLGRIRLGDIVDVGDGYSLNDTTFGLGFGNSDFVGIGNTMYRIAPTANGKAVCGIYCPVASGDWPNNHAHLITIWNDSAFYVPFDSSIAGVTNGRKILTPFILGAQGMAILVHDEHDDGWRVVSVYNPLFTTYTSVWSSSGTQPTLGTGGSVTAVFKEDGKEVNVEIRLVLGTGFSFGTGNIGFTLPVAPAANQFGQWSSWALDVGTANHPLLSLVATLNGNACVTAQSWASPSAVISAAAPFTFVASDQIRIVGSYRRA